MTFALRPLTEGERDAYDDLRATALFGRPTPEQSALAWSTRDLDRVFGAFEGERMIGGATSYAFSMSVPGGAVAAVGVAGVAVLPTHTRRGALRQLMHAIVDTARDRGEPVSCLWASEPGIYPRFGYGVGTAGLHLSLPRADGAFAEGVEVAGEVRLSERVQPADLAPHYERMAESTPGVIARSDAWWARRLHDPDRKLRAALTAGGYALYRVDGGWGERGPDNTLAVQELVAPEPAAAARLWRYLLDIDLVTTVTAGHRPVDDPIQWLLAAPRFLQRRVAEGMWVRVLDLPAALQARAYAAPLDLALGVADRTIPANDGTWRLAVDASGKATVETSPARRAVDIELDVGALGMVYLGGIRFTDLVRAGRIRERTPGAAGSADRAFAWSPAPWAVTWF